MKKLSEVTEQSKKSTSKIINEVVTYSDKKEDAQILTEEDKKKKKENEDKEYISTDA